MEKIFKIDNFLHLAAKKIKENNSDKIQKLLSEGISIVSIKKENSGSDPRYNQIINELSALIGDGDPEEDPALKAIYKIYEIANPSTPGSGDKIEDAMALGVNENHNAYNLIYRLNQVAIKKLPKIISDIKNFNTDKYENCNIEKGRNWTHSDFSKRTKHNENVIEILDRILNNQKIFFTPEDFFSAIAPVVTEYYSVNQQKMAQISKFLLLNKFRNYVKKSIKGNQIQNIEELRKELVNPKYENKGMPWHLNMFIDDQGKKHLFAEKLLEDFTNQLENEDPEAICLLFSRVYKIKNIELIKSGFFEAKNKSEESSIEDIRSTRSLAETDMKAGEEARHQTLSSSILLKNKVLLDNSLFSNGSDSLISQFNNKISLFSSGLSKMISLINPDNDPIRHEQLIALNSDFQEAAIGMQKKIEGWQYIYDYETDLRTVNGKKINKWGVSNLDIIFERATHHDPNPVFLISGNNKIVTIKLSFYIGSKSIDVDKHLPDGRIFATYSNLKVWQLKDIDILISWRSFDNLGITSDSVNGNLTEDAKAGDTVLNVRNAGIFKPDSEIEIVSNVSPQKSANQEAKIEQNLFIKNINQNQITLKAPIKFNWPISRRCFIRLKSNTNAEFPEQIEKIASEQNIEVSLEDNRRETKEKIGEALSTLNYSWIVGLEETGDIGLLADLVRDEMSRRPDLIADIMSGMQGGKKELKSASESWQRANKDQYQSFLNMKTNFVKYLKRKISYFQKISNLNDEAIQCFDTIGWSVMQKNIDDLQKAINTTLDRNTKNELIIKLNQIKNAQSMFKALFAAAETSSYKQEVTAYKKINWLDRGIDILIDEGKINELLTDTGNKNLYETIKVNAQKVLLSSLESISDLHILDFAATMGRGKHRNAEINRCKNLRDESNDFMKRFQDDADVMEVIKILYKNCNLPQANTVPLSAPASISPTNQAPAAVLQPSQATKISSCHECHKKQNISLFNNIDEWLKYMARKAYLE